MAKIEDYAVIGDCRSAALVARDGSIDWLCWPRFDSDACFAALLGTTDNGRWLIAPRASATVSRRYRDDTLVLETDFTTAGGSVRLVDFMPIAGHQRAVVRLVTGLAGRVDMLCELVLRFDYGLVEPWVTRANEETLIAIAGPDMVVLRTPVPIGGKDLRSVGEFTVEAGETVPFVLSYGASHLPPPPAIDCPQALRETETFWRGWSRRSREAGPWTNLVRRSLITLKALTDRDTGGIVAAASTSLPESLGGTRNWDYRYCWLRDSTLTLVALIRAGFHEEAARWQDWLHRAVAGSPRQVRIMYGVGGERRLDEWEVPWLCGYENARPVRIGNAASTQLQVDVFGQLFDTFTQALRAGLVPSPRSRGLGRALIERLEEVWHLPDAGIWEIRGEPRHFTHSRVMAWVAFDRAAQRERYPHNDRRRWRRLADSIHAEICEKGFDAGLNSFVQYYGANHLDASLLLMPIVGFLPIDDPRIVGTIAAIEGRLMVGGLVQRYETEHGVDGLPPGEGAFLACSFWLADCHVLAGRIADARALFERLAALVNDVGLLAEEYDPADRRMLGNFPQAFSHVALVNTALNLALAEGPAVLHGAPPPHESVQP